MQTLCPNQPTSRFSTHTSSISEESFIAAAWLNEYTQSAADDALRFGSRCFYWCRPKLPVPSVTLFSVASSTRRFPSCPHGGSCTFRGCRHCEPKVNRGWRYLGLPDACTSCYEL